MAAAATDDEPPLLEAEGAAAASQQAQQAPHQLMREEERVTGAVRPAVYKAYVSAVRSPWLLVLAAVSFVIANGTQFLQQVRDGTGSCGCVC